MKTPHPILFALTALLISTPVLRAAVFSDFEPTTYIAGTNFVGTDGWESFSGTDAYVTPDPLNTGDLSVLQGTQSAALDNGTYLDKTFSSAGITLTDDTTVSILMNSTTTSSQERFLFASDISGETPAGIYLDSGGVIGVYSSYGLTDTTVSYVAGDTYKLSLALDLPDGTFTAYSQDITSGGAVEDLGTYNGAAGSLSAAAVSSGGGIFIKGSALTTFDDIEVNPTGAVPEPAPMALMLVGLAALGMFRWKKHMQAMLS